MNKINIQTWYFCVTGMILQDFAPIALQVKFNHQTEELGSYLIPSP